MAKSRVSIHAIPHHDPNDIVNYARDLQPPLILTVNPSAGFISDCYRVSGASLYSLRNHALSEQKEDMYRDPAGTGMRHAREMVEWSDKLYAEAAGRPMPPTGQTILPGINEPLVMSNEQISAVVAYNVAYLDGLTQRGRRGSCLEFSVGWPRNSGQGSSPEWEPFRPVYEAAKRGNHYPSIHEYWPHEGPSYWAEWLCYRAVRWIPSYWADLDFIFTEVGLDDAAAPGRPHAFWKHFFYSNPHAYVNQYIEYERNNRTLTNQDGVTINVLGYAIFTSDYGGREWEGADIREIDHLFVQMKNTVDFPEKHTVHLPDIDAPTNPPDVPTTPPAPLEETEEVDWIINSLSRVFGFDPRLAKAILRVESGNRPFVNGKPVIRNEVHLLPAYGEKDDMVYQHFRWNQERPWENQEWRPGINEPWRPVHSSQEEEWKVFNFIKNHIDWRAAHMTLGMGAAQIMGFNHDDAQYASAEEMLKAFSDSERGAANQVLAMFAYFYKNDMVEDIRHHRLENVARKYNGSGNVPFYVKRFKEEYNALGG